MGKTPTLQGGGVVGAWVPTGSAGSEKIEFRGGERGHVSVICHTFGGSVPTKKHTRHHFGGHLGGFGVIWVVLGYLGALGAHFGHMRVGQILGPKKYGYRPSPRGVVPAWAPSPTHNLYPPTPGVSKKKAGLYLCSIFGGVSIRPINSVYVWETLHIHMHFKYI